MLGTDTVTLFKKQPDGSFSKHVVDGVQWSGKTDVANANGRAIVTNYYTVTFFEGTYEKLDLPNFSEEDAVFRGVVGETVVDGKISALLKIYPESGVIKSVSNNSNRRHLKNMRVVLV